jgi:hypothetical protein
MTGLRIVTGQVRGESVDGKDTTTGPITCGGFKPNTLAHVVMMGWSVKFRFGDHPILEMGIWMQQAVLGAWEWCLDANVHPDGSIECRYYGFAGSENRDNPFDLLVNYAVIGEEP